MRPPTRTALAGICALFTILLPALAAAQPTPLTAATRISNPPAQTEYLPALAALPEGGFVVAWASWSPSQAPHGKDVLARRLTASLAPIGEPFQVSETAASDFFIAPAVAAHAAGNFFVAWEGTGARLLGRAFAPTGAPLGGEIEIHRSLVGAEFRPAVAAVPTGFIVAWSETAGAGVLLQRFDPAGQPVGTATQAAPAGASQFQRDPAVAADAGGSFVVVWETQGNATRDLFGRRFDATGAPLGESFQIDLPTTVSAFPEGPAVASTADGSFVVAWADLGRGSVFARRYGADGAPLGPPFPLSPPFGGGQAPSVAFDPVGSLTALWSGFISPQGRSEGQWFDGAGRDRGPRFAIDSGGVHPTGIGVTAPTPGEFVAAWHGRVPPSGVGIFVQRFRIPEAGSEPCVVRSDRLVCNPLRTAAGPPVELPALDGHPDDVWLLGNLDGNAQDDPCHYRTGIFSCDLDHDSSAEMRLSFGGAPGDLPLLGDVNGDGRDDACLRRGRRFACDTAHNGGTAEVQILFGLKTDLPLLGDVDGDGDDEPCVVRGNRYLCDAAHDGRGADVAVTFGQPGDVPLLGDVDGDGDDDFCVFREDRFLCDTAHDGGGAEREIIFGQPGEVPLLGNVDGF